jgi:hypothetical protein
VSFWPHNTLPSQISIVSLPASAFIHCIRRTDARPVLRPPNARFKQEMLASMPARKLRSLRYTQRFDHGFDAETAFLVEGDIAHAKRLGLGDVGRAGIAAVARDLAWRLAVRRNVALQYGQKALGIGWKRQRPQLGGVGRLDHWLIGSRRSSLRGAPARPAGEAA